MKYDKNNIFAKILRGEIPCKAVYEDEFALAFNDIEPATPIHVIVIPKAEYISFDDFAQQSSPDFLAGFFSAVQKVATKVGAVGSGYRIISNHGIDASQSVAHFHVHILAGKKLGGLLP